MKYRGVKLRQMLAAEYALGTLHGRARARFRQLLREDLALQREVLWWEQRLAGLAGTVAPVAPREQVWAQIDFRINATSKVVTPIQPAPPPRADARVSFWRVWSVLSTAAALLLGVGLWQQLHTAPQFIMVPKIVAVKVPAAAPYVALLQPDKSDARWRVSMYPDRGVMKVTAAGHYSVDDTHSLELWLLEAHGPRALGLLPKDGAAELPLPRELALQGDVTLAVSVEPQGGSPTGLPTGPVILSAPALQKDKKNN